MKKTIIVVISCLFSSLVFSQVDPRSYEDSYINQINPLVRAQFGNVYSVGVEVIDTVIGTRNSIETDEITDPYGTLQHCVLFYATKDDGEQDSSFFGVYKNGSILWQSGRLIKGYPLHTFATTDINNDGQVDIVTTWFSNSDPRYQDMWIFSWNGSSGGIINQIDPAVYGLSIISGVYFEIIDANSDGVKEVRSISYDGSEKTYIWNGTAYVFGSPAQQVPQRTLLPANQLTVGVATTVTKSGNIYTYSYTWTNNSSSKQPIQSVHLRGVGSTYSGTKPGKWFFAAWPDSPVAGWNSIYYYDEMIKRELARTVLVWWVQAFRQSFSSMYRDST